jgi:hypothetical protein
MIRLPEEFQASRIVWVPDPCMRKMVGRLVKALGVRT